MDIRQRAKINYQRQVQHASDLLLHRTKQLIAMEEAIDPDKKEENYDAFQAIVKQKKSRRPL